MDGSKINPISVARRGQQAGQINDIAERNGRTKVIIIINGTKKKKLGLRTGEMQQKDRGICISSLRRGGK